MHSPRSNVRRQHRDLTAHNQEALAPHSQVHTVHTQNYPVENKQQGEMVIKLLMRALRNINHQIALVLRWLAYYPNQIPVIIFMFGHLIPPVIVWCNKVSLGNVANDIYLGITTLSLLVTATICFQFAFVHVETHLRKDRKKRVSVIPLCIISLCYNCSITCRLLDDYCKTHYCGRNHHRIKECLLVHVYRNTVNS